MNQKQPIHTLFIDVGGVLLTNAWDRDSRKAASTFFNLNFEKMEKKHQSVVNLFETGKISLDDYLDNVIFNEKRNFSKEEFKIFLFEQSKPFPEMIQLISQIKKEKLLKVVVLSNESFELTQYRIHKFKLLAFIDFFIVSCFIHLQKPKREFYQTAFNLTQINPEESLYIDDRKLLIETAKTFGIHVIHHINYETTKAQLFTFLE